jgi:hypothetical protein
MMNESALPFTLLLCLGHSDGVRAIGHGAGSSGLHPDTRHY